MDIVNYQFENLEIICSGRDQATNNDLLNDDCLVNPRLQEHEFHSESQGIQCVPIEMIEYCLKSLE